MIALILWIKVLDQKTVHRNGGKNRLNVGESTSVIEFIFFNCSKLSLELVNNEFIGFVPIVVIENDWMTKMHSIR